MTRDVPYRVGGALLLWVVPCPDLVAISMGKSHKFIYWKVKPRPWEKPDMRPNGLASIQNVSKNLRQNMAKKASPLQQMPTILSDGPMANPKRYWEITKPKLFLQHLDFLAPQDKWRVVHTLNFILPFEKNPQKLHQYTPCSMYDDDTLLFGISKDGTGRHRLELVVRIDRTKKLIRPVAVRAAKS